LTKKLRGDSSVIWGACRS